MGAQKSKTSSIQSISFDSHLMDSSYTYETNQLDQLQGCCGIQSKRIKKKYSNWQDNIIEVCQKYKNSMEWTPDVVKIIKNIDKDKNRDKSKETKNSVMLIEKNKFIQQFNQLKNMKFQDNTHQRTSSVSVAQVINFKANLRDSVILNYDQLRRTSKQVKGSKIMSVIDPSGGARNSQRSIFSKSSISYENPDNAINNLNINMATNINKNQSRNIIISATNSMTGRSRQSARESGITKNSKIYLRQSVINLVDDTMSSIFKGEQKQVSKLNVYCLDIFVKFTIMLEKHLTNSQHQICQIIQCFYEHFYKFCEKHLHEPAQNNRKDKNKVKQQNQDSLSALYIQGLINNIKMLIVLVTEVVQGYYNIKQLQKFQHSTNNYYFLINNYDNLISIVTAILFKNQKFYTFLFDIVRKFNKQKEELVNKKYSIIHGKGPNYFSVNDEYCLNKQTFNKFVSQMSSVQSNLQNFVPEDLVYDIQEPPYLRCSQSLLKITKSRTPVAKMKTILQCAQRITESITTFYKKNKIELSNKKKMLDADQVLSIFCYVLSINPLPDIHSHLFIIQHFATEHQKISMTGYYYSVLACAIDDLYNGIDVSINGHDGELPDQEDEDQTNKLGQSSELLKIQREARESKKQRQGEARRQKQQNTSNNKVEQSAKKSMLSEAMSN